MWNIVPAGGINHVMPDNDRRVHLSSPACWCGPTKDGYCVMVHHSQDRREFFECDELPSEETK